MEVLALIPARSGSKSIKNKNIRMINGKPMLAYSIVHGLKARLVSRVIVSTDSPAYAEIAESYGAEVPFLRPSAYAQDDSLDLEVFRHALSWLRDEEGYQPELVVHLRPTYPLRDPQDIDAMTAMMMEDKEIDSVRCIVKAKEIPYKMWTKQDGGRIAPLMQDMGECYNMPRQKLPQVYYQNACIDVVRTQVIMEQNSMSGTKIAGYEMEHFFDIDTEEEFLRAESILKMKDGGNRFVFDIDGVIAKPREDLDYRLAEPDAAMIKIINRLYEWNNEIILFTARGYVTKKDWEEVTRAQMERWGLHYHQLLFGKPNADYYVDDKMIGLDFLKSLF